MLHSIVQLLAVANFAYAIYFNCYVVKMPPDSQRYLVWILVKIWLVGCIIETKGYCHFSTEDNGNTWPTGTFGCSFYTFWSASSTLLLAVSRFFEPIQPFCKRYIVRLILIYQSRGINFDWFQIRDFFFSTIAFPTGLFVTITFW